jgi:hypothetical protein
MTAFSPLSNLAALPPLATADPMGDGLAQELVAAGTPAAICDLAADILCSDALLEALGGDASLHGNGFFKIPLIASAAGKVRLHIWFPGAPCEENIHDHRWSMTSVIVAGRLTSEGFREVEGSSHRRFRHTGTGSGGYCLADEGRIAVVRTARQTLAAGTVYSMAPGELHRICRTAAEPMTMTLMVQGAALAGSSRLITDRANMLDEVPGAPLGASGLAEVLRRAIEHLSPATSHLEAA